MKVAAFDYQLPSELIAREPAETRSDSRMLVLGRSTGEPEIGPFQRLPSLLEPGDVLVVNNTRVLPVRFVATKRETGAQISVTLLGPIGDSHRRWRALLKPGKRAKPGTVLQLDTHEISVEAKSETGIFELAFDTDDVVGVLEQLGSMPLPPYMQRPGTEVDQQRYQTVYASVPGAVAAPTAGLHFTDDVLRQVEAVGVHVVRLTLHVGYGTFKPVEADTAEEHVMHSEWYELGEESAARINQAKANGGRVVAVGTTCVRVLETLAAADGVRAGCGETDIFLYPPYQPRIVDCLLTNFHLPRSTLLMLVSCFASRERILAAYEAAIAARMRFYSYGDCMFLH